MRLARTSRSSWSSTAAGTWLRRSALRKRSNRIDRCGSRTSSCRAISANTELAGATSIPLTDRKSTRLNSSHLVISYAVFCLKKKKKKNNNQTWIYGLSLHNHTELYIIIKESHHLTYTA